MDKSVKDFNVRLRTIRIWELIVAVIVMGFVSFILSCIFPIIDESSDLFFIVFLFLIALFFMYALRGARGLDRNFEQIFEDDNKKEILYVFATNILFAYLITFIIVIIDMLIGYQDPTWISLFYADTVNPDSGAIILSAIGSIIFAPLMEELIFRGVLFNRLKIRTGIIPAMIISSIIFGFGHDIGGITSAFLFGMCMCILYTKTDNILIPMSVHFLNNLTATVLVLTNIDMWARTMPWIIPCIIITAIGSVYLVKYIIKESKKLKKQYN